VGGLQGRLYRDGQVVADGVQVDRVFQPGCERGDGGLAVVPGPVEPPVHPALHPLPDGVEQGRRGQGGGCGDIIGVLSSAASTEPDAAAVVAEGARRHDRGAGNAAPRLAELGALAPGVTPEQAGAVLSMMLLPATWQQLTQRSGWSFEEAEAWLTAALTRLLLEPAHLPAVTRLTNHAAWASALSAAASTPGCSAKSCHMRGHLV
jgi:hypothetical protein